jgi:hypothetical protein
MAFENFGPSRTYHEEDRPPLTEGIEPAVLEARYRWALWVEGTDPVIVEERRSRLTEDEAARVEADVERMKKKGGQ